ncbi:MAG: hypothetical protein JW891_06605, partial [Candidatus Lokiarchaeota archaeon]|nr:hypothetical protein [Candidatus Lokiarchaeota archaeon]
RTYPFFWGYISYGLSALSGLPLVNTNTLLFLYYYIPIASIYLIIRLLLKNYKEKYVIIASLFTIILHGFFFFRFEMYKLFSFSILNLCLFLFIAILKEKNLDDILSLERGATPPSERSFLTSYFLIGFLLLISFATYFFPLFIALAFILVYALVVKTEKKNEILRAFTIILASIFLFYLLFDIVTEFHLSRMTLSQFERFFHNYFIRYDIISFQVIIYSLFLVIIMLFLIIERILLIISKRTLKFKIKNLRYFNYKNIIFAVISIFIILFFIDFIYRMLYFAQIFKEINRHLSLQILEIFVTFLLFVIFVAIIYEIHMCFKYKNEKKILLIHLMLLVLTCCCYGMLFFWLLNNLKLFFQINNMSGVELYFLLCRIFTGIHPFSGLISTYFISFDIGFIYSSFFLFYTEIIIYFLGPVGIIALLLSYLIYKQDKKLFKLLMAWIIVIFILSSSYIVYEWIAQFPLSPLEIDTYTIMNMFYWYWRIFGYAYIPIGIIASIGIIKVVKKCNRFVHIKKYPLLKYGVYSTICLIIVFTFIQRPIGIYFNEMSFRQLNDDDVATLDWASEYLDFNANIIVDDEKIALGNAMKVMTYCKINFFYKIFLLGTYSENDYNDKIESLKSHEYQYILITTSMIKRYTIGRDIIENFYNQTIFQKGDIKILEAPYFTSAFDKHN